MGPDLWRSQVLWGRCSSQGLGIGGWAWEGPETMITSFYSFPLPVSPERYNYDTSSSSKRTESSCRRRRRSSSSSDAQQGQWETGEPSWVDIMAISLSFF